MNEQYGIIDIGSNTMRLVIYEQHSGGFHHEIENTKVTARLRKYLVNGTLTSEGIRILLSTLEQFQESTRFHQLQRVICTATATIRQASNQEEVKRLVEEHTDFKLRILSEFEEAYYGYLAVINSTSFKEGITIDIGGGSTEITYFHNRELVNYHSFPFGALSLRQQFVKGDVPTVGEYIELQRYLLEQFQTLPWICKKGIPVIAIGGSARNMVKIHQNMISYPISGLHQYEMDKSDVELVLQHIASIDFAELQKLEGLAKDRADTIIPAVEVFHTLLQVTEASSFILSRKGLREGLFYEEITKPFGVLYYPNVVEESFHLLAHEYEIDMHYVMQLMKHTTALCKELEKCYAASFTKEDLHFIRRAAKVYNIGKYIDEESSSQHTFYLLANKTIDGIMHKDRVKLALLASYKSKLSFKQYIKPFETWFSKEEQRKIRMAGAILQFAAALNVTKRNAVEAINILESEEGLIIYIWCCQKVLAEKVEAEKQKKQLEKALKRNIKLHFQIRS